MGGFLSRENPKPETRRSPNGDSHQTGYGDRMTFELAQADSGRWRWMLMHDEDCLSMSTKSFRTELDCLLEVEQIRQRLSTLTPKAQATPIERGGPIFVS